MQQNLIYSLAIDGTTYFSNTAQMVLLMRGVTAEFNVVDKFLALKSIHGTTKGENFFQTVDSTLKNFELPL